jgi:hypothetical protein
MKTILKTLLGLIVLAAILFSIDRYIPALLAEKLPKIDKVLVKNQNANFF